jgi:hypothetical protein
MKKVIGALLVSIPFVGVSAHMVVMKGWVPMLITWGTVFVVVAVIGAGVALLQSD